MPLKALSQFLDDHGIMYVTVRHSKAYTASQIAASAHIPGKELAKTVMIRLDGKMAMVVLPSSYRVDFDRLRAETGAEHVELAGEHDFARAFPDCEVGAMPPFGNLYDIPVLVADELTQDEEIAFNAGTHTELVRLAYKDFERLVEPRIVDVSL